MPRVVSRIHCRIDPLSKLHFSSQAVVFDTISIIRQGL